MVIIDSKKPKIKKIIIAVVIAAAIITIFLMSLVFRAKKINSPLLQKTNQEIKTSRPSEEETSQADSQKPEDLNKDRETCLSFFEGLENMSTDEVKVKEKDLVMMYVEKSASYNLCLAIKKNDKKYCDPLEVNPEKYQECLDNFVKYSKIIFPSLRANRCDPEFIDACKSTGENNCESSCRGLVMKEIAECDNILNNPVLKNACLAINRDDVSLCNLSGNEDEETACQETFYFFEAVKENNASLLENIKVIDFKAIAQLYFDPNYQCEKVLTGMSYNACGKK